MTVLRSANVKHTGATEAPELLTGEISEGQELESTTSNPINHTKSTIAINLHVVQSATATHVTTCAELLPRDIPEHPMVKTP